jgi:hypothetical protein
MKLMIAGRLFMILGLAAVLIGNSSAPCRGAVSDGVSGGIEGVDIMDLEEQSRNEVIALHQFFEDWFVGREGTDYSRLDSALAADFEMVTPGGAVVTRGPLVEQLRGAFGRWKDSPQKIEIREIAGLTLGGGWTLVRYEEWHLPEEGEAVGRVSTAIFRSREDAPRGVEWVRLHETWIPSD